MAYIAVTAHCCTLAHAQSKSGPETPPVVQEEETVTFYRLPEADLIIIPVGLEGKKTVYFILDTGAQNCAVSREIAKELRLPREPRLDANGKSERLAPENAVIKLFQIGAMAFDDVRCALLPRERLPSRPGVVIDGIIGMQLLQRLAFKLDFSEAKATFWYPGNLTDAQVRSALIPTVLLSPLELREYRLFAKGKVNKEIDEAFLLDTGAQQTYVSAGTAKAANLKTVKKEDRWTAYGLVAYEFGHVEAITVGTVTLSSPLVGIWKDSPFRLQAGVLGLNALAQRVLFIDTPGRRFYAGLKAKEVAK